MKNFIVDVDFVMPKRIEKENKTCNNCVYYDGFHCAFHGINFSGKHYTNNPCNEWEGEED